MALVAGTREAYGLAPSLRAVGLARSTWYHHTRTRVAYARKYAHLEAPLKAIAQAHPEYGYRRTTAELRETYGYRVNRKVVERLHRLWDLSLRRTVTRPKPSAVRRAIDAAGAARQPAVGAVEGGDRSAGGLLHGLHRTPLRRRDPEGVADPHPRSRDEVRAGLRRWSVGQLRSGALGLDGRGADPWPASGTRWTGSSSTRTGTPCSPATHGPASSWRRVRGSPTRSADRGTTRRWRASSAGSRSRTGL